MRWRGVGLIRLAHWKIFLYLPSFLRTRLVLLMQNRTPSKKQLEKIEMLGERMGLTRNEVYAAYNPPLNLANGRSRLTPLSACITLLIIIIIVFVIIVVGNYLNPPSVYGYGTRYGSIKPQDFISK